jgi:AraC-like DNA-binding protein
MMDRPAVFLDIDLVHHRLERPAWHQPAHHELLLLLRGSGTVLLDGIETPLGAGQWVFHPAGVPHRSFCAQRGSAELMMLTWSGRAPASRQRQGLDRAGHLRAALGWMLDLTTTGSTADAAVLHALLSAVIHDLARPPRRGSPLLRSVTIYVRDHLAQPLRVKAVAAVVNLSPAQLMRRFRAETGTTLMRWVQARRLEEARRLLRSPTHLTLVEIARRVGFVSPSHLSRRYKAAFGMAPRAARRGAADGRTAPPTD